MRRGARVYLVSHWRTRSDKTVACVVETAVELMCVLSHSVAVVDLSFAPRRHVYQLGDELRCTALGNPAPHISILPVSGHEKSGAGWKSVVVVNTSWTQLQCNASNVVDGRTRTISDTMQFTVRPAGSLRTAASVPRKLHTAPAC